MDDQTEEYTYNLPATLSADTLRTCNNCRSIYKWSKSSATLKLRFCGFLCERSVIGFTYEAFIKNQFSRKITIEEIAAKVEEKSVI